jgi:hypothetical protein
MAMAATEGRLRSSDPNADLPSEVEIVDFMLSANLHRRHLTGAQRAFIVAERYDIRVRERGGDPAKNTSIFGPSEIERAVETAKVSSATMRDAAHVAEHGEPELKEAVRKGEISTKAAAPIADRPPEEQRAAVAEGKKRGRPKGSTNKPKAEGEAKPEREQYKLGSLDGLRAHWLTASANVRGKFMKEFGLVWGSDPQAA